MRVIHVKRRPKQLQPSDVKTAAELMPPLDDDHPLASAIERMPPHQYARATAREFAIGKYSKRQRRRRYAVT